jgi:hypothetical protein
MPVLTDIMQWLPDLDPELRIIEFSRSIMQWLPDLDPELRIIEFSRSEDYDGGDTVMYYQVGHRGALGP